MPDSDPSMAAINAWSATIDEALLVAHAIGRSRATSSDGVIVKFDAVRWWLELDESILDAQARR